MIGKTKSCLGFRKNAHDDIRLSAVPDLLIHQQDRKPDDGPEMASRLSDVLGLTKTIELPPEIPALV